MLRQLRDARLRGHRRQPRVLAGPVRDQPLALRALDAADRAFRFKSAVKEIARCGACSPRSWPSRSTTRAAPASTCTSRSRTTPAGTSPATPRARTGCRRSPGTRMAGVLRHAPGAERAAQPDDQLLQAVRAGHAGAVADRLGPGQPQRDGAHPARARRRGPAGDPARRRHRQPVPGHRRRRRGRLPRHPGQGRAAGQAGGLRVRPGQRAAAAAAAEHGAGRAGGGHRTGRRARRRTS